MSTHVFCAKVSRTEPRIGEAVRSQMMQAQKDFPAHTVTFVAAIPRVIKVRAFEYEVTEADVLLEVL